MGNQDLIKLLAKMGARETKSKYSIGDYWNVVDEAHDALVERDAENAALKAEVEALRKLCGEAHGSFWRFATDQYKEEIIDLLHRAAKGE